MSEDFGHKKEIFMKSPDTVVEAINGFTDLIKQHELKSIHSVTSLRKKINDLISKNPMAFNEENIKEFLAKRSQLLKLFLLECVGAQISETMQRLDPSIYSLKRHLFFQV